MTGKKILIVEDEIIVALDLKLRLQSLGYCITAIVTNGEDCLKRIEQDRPELVLLDIIIKGEMDGIETAGKIKSFYNIPFIYLTAHSDDATIERVKKTGPYGYIIKPFELKELKTAIELALYKYQSERQVLESEAKYRTLFETAMDAVIVSDENGNIDSFNGQALELFGYTESEMEGKKIEELLNIPADRVNRLLKDNVKNERVESQAYHKDGRKIIIEASYSAWMQAKKGRVTCIIRDVTARKMTEEELQRMRAELEELVHERTTELKSLLNQSTLPVRIFGRNGVCMFNNDAAMQLGMLKSQDRPVFEDELFIKNGLVQNIRDIFTNGGLFVTPPLFLEAGEFEGYNNMSSSVLVFHFYSVAGTRQKVSKVVNLIEDVTEPYKAHKINLALEDQKSRSALLIEGLEEERVRISRELHDSIGQIMTAARLNIELFEKTRGERTQYINDAKKMLQKASIELRNIIFALHPSDFDKSDLNELVAVLIKELFGSSGIEIKYACSDDLSDISGKAKITIYRIIQEALNNVIKHANASLLEINIIRTGDCLNISIKDDGNGFVTNEMGSMHGLSGRGLSNIRERTAIFNGNFELDSQPDNGTCINVLFPLNEVL